MQMLRPSVENFWWGFLRKLESRDIQIMSDGCSHI